ncbi:MAG: hypothetical protein V4459_07990 [Pseudomonadota bacterium]
MKSWHRIGPGEEAVVDRFYAATVRRLNRRLDTANGWHRSGRHYAFDPPLPGPRTPEMFALDAVELRRATPRRLPWIAIILFSIPNLVFVASTLIGFFR